MTVKMPKKPKQNSRIPKNTSVYIHVKMYEYRKLCKTRPSSFTYYSLYLQGQIIHSP